MADLTLSKQEVLPWHGAGGLGGLHWALAAGGVLRVCWERVRGGHRDSDPGMTSPPRALKTHSTMETRLRWQALPTAPAALRQQAARPAGQLQNQGFACT